MPPAAKPPTSKRRSLTLAGLTTIAIALAGPVRAQEGTDVDLKPADFVPEEPVAIRVDDLQPGKQGSDVSVTVLNRTKTSAREVVECTLYDADREDLGIATGGAFTVRAGERVAATVVGAEGAKYAECRVQAVN